MEIRIEWEVEDGYVGKSRTQYLTIDIEKDIMSLEEWNDLSDHEKEDHINSFVDEDFRQKIYPILINFEYED